MSRLTRFLRGETEGQAIVLIALVLLVLFMFVGLAVDAGQLYAARRTMQEAADSAAYAGAVVIYQGGTKSLSGPCGLTLTTPSDARNAAVTDATKNGFTDGVAGSTVTINNPPRSGPYCGDANYVEVIIQSSVQTTLVPAESGLTTVRVRGVAGAEPLNNGYAIMALNRGNTPSAFTDGPNADIHLTGGGVFVNSISATAATNSQSDPCRFTIQAPFGIDISGGSGSAWPSSPCLVPPSAPFPVNTTQPQVPDPFAGFPKPSTAGLPLCSSMSSPGCQDALGRQNPGVYTASLGGAGGTTLTLNPGIYILEAGINIAGNADMISRNDLSCQGPPNTCGVFFFNTKTNYPNSAAGDTCGAVNLVGNAATNLQAQTIGTYANMLVYQDPICTAGMTIKGNGSFTSTGSVYLPSASFAFSGNNATLNGSQLVADTVNVQNGNIAINFSGATTAQPILPRLSE